MTPKVNEMNIKTDVETEVKWENWAHNSSSPWHSPPQTRPASLCYQDTGTRIGSDQTKKGMNEDWQHTMPYTANEKKNIHI